MKLLYIYHGAVINRSALIRIPNSGKNGKRIEFRSPICSNIEGRT